MKNKETLEEVARKYANITHNRPLDEEERYYKDYQKHDGFIEGAKWQAERMYSEEEVKDMLFEALNHKKEECCITHTTDSIVRKIIQQFKNK
jgi:hypothetical protein